MTKCFESFHSFYDPVAYYIDEFCSSNGWLCLYRKDQFIYPNLLSLSMSSLFFIKHDNKVGLWDHLLDWLHWKSKFSRLGSDSQ